MPLQEIDWGLAERSKSCGKYVGACTHADKVLVRYCTRCVYATVQGACTLLYKVLVRMLTRRVYATVQGDCTLPHKAVVQIECTPPEVVGAIIIHSYKYRPCHAGNTLM